MRKPHFTTEEFAQVLIHLDSLLAETNLPQVYPFPWPEDLIEHNNTRLEMEECKADKWILKEKLITLVAAEVDKILATINLSLCKQKQSSQNWESKAIISNDFNEEKKGEVEHRIVCEFTFLIVLKYFRKI